MGCDWYNFSTIRMTGVIFFAKEIPIDIMKKNKLIMIPFPIHDDLNTSDIEPEKISLFFSKEDGVYRHNNLSKEWADVPEDDVITKFNNGDTKWFVDRESLYVYIYVKDIINSSRIDVPGPHEITSFSVSIMYNCIDHIDSNDISIIEGIYGNDKHIHGIIKDIPLRLCDIVLSSSTGTCAIRELDGLLKRK